jgi:Nuclease-related domain
MRNRPGERSRTIVRRAWWNTARKNPLAWVCLILFGVVFAEVMSLMPFPTWWRAYIYGFVTATVLATLAWVIHVLSGSHSYSMGKLGEEATAEAVAGWRQRRNGWRLINGIYLAGHGDIDHILVGPGGVFVIESKWTTKHCRIEHGEIVGLMGRVPIAQATDGALKVEKLLRYGSQRFEVEVKPVVVIWGSGGLILEDGSIEVDGVLVCEGRREKDWVRQLAGLALKQPDINAIASVLESQIARQTEQSIH